MDSNLALAQFQMVAWSCSFELDAVNIIRTLEAAGIPASRSQRGDEYPLIDPWEIRDLLQSQVDLVIDGGNSYFMDTERRFKTLTKEGFHYMGLGVSGGAEGALWGPSMMAGGDEASYQAVEPILVATAARAHDGRDAEHRDRHQQCLVDAGHDQRLVGLKCWIDYLLGCWNYL